MNTKAYLERLFDSKIYNLFIILAIVSIVVRAMVEEFSFDEVWTFNEVAKNSFLELIRYDNFKFANNQILNSLYFKLIRLTGCPYHFAYRGLSMLGFALYLSANNKIVKLLKLPKITLLILIVAPYFFQLSIGRGYALAIGALSYATYYLLLSINHKSVKYINPILLWGSLSFLSVYSFIYPVGALYLVFLVVNFRRIKEIIRLKTILSACLTLVLIMYVAYAGKIVHDFDPIIEGTTHLFGSDGFFMRVIDYFTLGKQVDIIPFYQLLRIFTILIITSPLLLFMRNKTELPNKIGPIIIIATLFLLLLSHFVLHTKLPTHRATMFLHYYTLLSLIIAFSKTNNWLKLSAAIALVFILSLSSIRAAVSVYHLTEPSYSKTITNLKNDRVYTTDLDLPFYFKATAELKNIPYTDLHYLVSMEEIEQLTPDNSNRLLLICNRKELLQIKTDYAILKSIRHQGLKRRVLIEIK